MSFNTSLNEGSIGEQLYIDYLNNKQIKFYDVRYDTQCQWYDIDFIIPQNNNTKEDIINHVKYADPNNRINRQKEIGYTVEVKLDKATHSRYITKSGYISNGTGNIVYELIAHNMPGCLSRCCADFILYVCIDMFDEVTTLQKVYMINLYNWRQLLTNDKNLSKHLILKPSKFVLEKGKQVEENVLNMLCPVNLLLPHQNIIKDLTNQFKPFFPNNLHISN